MPRGAWHLSGPPLGCSPAPLRGCSLPTCRAEPEGSLPLKTGGRRWGSSVGVGMGTDVPGFARGENVLQPRRGWLRAGGVQHCWAEIWPAGVGSYRASPQNPAVPSVGPTGTPFPSAAAQPEWGSDAGLPRKTHGLCSGASCAEKSVLCCFVSLVMNCWAEQYFPCSQPLCSTRLEKPLPAGRRLRHGL